MTIWRALPFILVFVILFEVYILARNHLILPRLIRMNIESRMRILESNFKIFEENSETLEKAENFFIEA